MKYSTWANVEAGVSEVSIPRSLLFFIYINDLPDKLLSNPKLFTDDTSVFSVVRNHTQYDIGFNADISRISEWPFLWEMNFNPDLTKQF